MKASPRLVASVFGILGALVILGSCADRTCQDVSTCASTPATQDVPDSGSDDSSPRVDDASAHEAAADSTTEEVFDPGTLSLTAWWRGSYDGSSWPGSPSEGTSESHELSEPLNLPKVGSAVNGFSPASFDGVNDRLVADGTLAAYLGASAYSGWALVNVAAVTKDETDPGNNECIFNTIDSQRWGVFFRNDGIGKTVNVYQYVGAAVTVSVATAFATNTWQLVQWRYDGTTLGIRVNGGKWASSPSAGIDVLTFGLRLGENVMQTAWLKGSVLEAALAKIVISDTDFDKVKAYSSTRYGLKL